MKDIGSDITRARELWEEDIFVKYWRCRFPEEHSVNMPRQRFLYNSIVYPTLPKLMMPIYRIPPPPSQTSLCTGIVK